MSRTAVYGRKRAAAGLVTVVSMMGMLFAASAQAQAPVGLGTAENFSVLAATTITNTGATTMARDYGLFPGTSVTGAPTTLGSPHVNDSVALQAQNALTAAKIDAAGRAVTASAGTELAGQTFLPGVYNATSALLFSSGILTLDAVGDPNAVFIFQVGSSLTTQSGTSVLLINGAQPCNVYWEVSQDVDLGTNSVFMGTVMAGNRITAASGATLDGRLLASNAAVNLNNNTITTSACAATPTPPVPPVVGGTPTTTPTPVGGSQTGGTTTPTPVGSQNTTSRARRLARARARRLAARRAARRAAARRAVARKRLARSRARRRAQQRRVARSPQRRPSFTG